MGRGIDVARHEVWRRRLRRYADWSGTVTEFCRREGVTTAAFYLWRKRLTRGGVQGVATASNGAGDDMQPADGARRGGVPFVELSLAGTVALVEIELPNGTVVRVPAAREATLRAAIRAAGELAREERDAQVQEVS